MNVMRWTAITVFCQLVMAVGFVSDINAQTRVALVDIGRVFKSHPEFSSELATLKSRADQFKTESQQLQQQLMQKAEVLNQFEIESDDYRDHEAKLAKESATMEVEQRNKMRNLLKREAELHFHTYIEISEAVSQYCEEYNIQLVLRFNSDEMNPKDPRSIMQQVNGGVVFHSQTADITTAIIQRVAGGKRQATTNGTTNR